MSDGASPETVNKYLQDKIAHLERQVLSDKKTIDMLTKQHKELERLDMAEHDRDFWKHEYEKLKEELRQFKLIKEVMN